MKKILITALFVIAGAAPCNANEVLSPSTRDRITQENISLITFISGMQPYQRQCFDELAVWCPEMKSSSEPVAERASNPDKKIVTRGELAKEAERDAKTQAELDRRNAIICRVEVMIQCGVDMSGRRALYQYIPDDYLFPAPVGYK